MPGAWDTAASQAPIVIAYFCFTPCILHASPPLSLHVAMMAIVIVEGSGRGKGVIEVITQMSHI